MVTPSDTRNNQLNLQDRLAQASPALFVLSLVPLHAAFFLDLAGDWTKVLFVHHIALLLIWLSEWKSVRTAAYYYLVGATTIAVLSWFFLDWLSVTIWLTLITTLSIERPVSSQSHNLSFTVTAAYLLTTLYFTAVPNLINIPLPQSSLLVTSGFLAIAILVAITSSLLGQKIPSRSQQPPQSVYLWPLAIMLISTLIIVLLYARSNIDYTLAVAMGIACAIVATTIVGNTLSQSSTEPSGRNSNDEMHDTAPLESWLLALSDNTDNLQIPEDYLAENLSNLVKLPWISGGKWTAFGHCGQFGKVSPYESTLDVDEIHIKLYSPDEHTPTQLRNSQLLLRTLKIGFESKVREQTLKKHSYLEAIYETGARVTHDVKNVLQSMNTLISAASGSTPEQAVDLQKLFQTQLPNLAQRLERTLSKLQDPGDVSRTFQVGRIWWENLKLQYANRGIQFKEDLAEDHLIPRDLFDRVAQNLLENAVRKQQSETSISITAKFITTSKQLTFSVCDSGSPVSSDVAKTLLQRPIDSTGGFGIGLYQAAKQAKQEGYVLDLVTNRRNKVCFALYAARNPTETPSVSISVRSTD